MTVVNADPEIEEFWSRLNLFFTQNKATQINVRPMQPMFASNILLVVVGGANKSRDKFLIIEKVP